MIRLIAALGNPGPEYESTRHNIAWMLLQHISLHHSLGWKNKFSGEYALYRKNEQNIVFLKPFTYMNRSGHSLQKAGAFFQIPPEDMLVIHDELELDFGVAGLKSGGGLGGHNGLRSIASSLGSRDFQRLRLGISRPHHDDITSYVLSQFHPHEQDQLDDYLSGAASLLERALSHGDFTALARMHRKDRFTGEA